MPRTLDTARLQPSCNRTRRHLMALAGTQWQIDSILYARRGTQRHSAALPDTRFTALSRR